MTAACPYCRGTGYYEPRDNDDALAWLRRWCRENGVQITYDDALSPPDAARAMKAFSGTGSEGALANDRTGEARIPYVKRPNGRVLYPLSGLADYLTSRA